MADRELQESPLARFGLPTRETPGAAYAGVRCSERAFLGHINLRGDAGDSAFIAQIRSVLAVDLPVVPNTTRAGRESTIYWLGPDEWLAVTPGGRERTLAKEMRAALGGTFSAVTEVGGGQTLLVLRGEAVRDLLSKECTLDFHPRHFPPGACAQTRLAKAPVLLRRVDDGSTFEIVVRRSFADYLWLWLEDAGAEYGLCGVREAPES